MNNLKPIINQEPLKSVYMYTCKLVMYTNIINLKTIKPKLAKKGSVTNANSSPGYTAQTNPGSTGLQLNPGYVYTRLF